MFQEMLAAGSGGGGDISCEDIINTKTWSSWNSTNETCQYSTATKKIEFENINQATSYTSGSAYTQIDFTNIDAIVVMGNISYFNSNVPTYGARDLPRIDIGNNAITDQNSFWTVETVSSNINLVNGDFACVLDTASVTGSKYFHVKVTQMTGYIDKVLLLTF